MLRSRSPPRRARSPQLHQPRSPRGWRRCGVFGDDLRCGDVLGVLGRGGHVACVIGLAAASILASLFSICQFKMRITETSIGNMLVRVGGGFNVWGRGTTPRKIG